MFSLPLLRSVSLEKLEGTAKTNQSPESIISPFSIFYFLPPLQIPVLSPDVKVAVAIGGRGIINQIFASLPCSLLHCPLLIDIQFVGRITKSCNLFQCYRVTHQDG